MSYSKVIPIGSMGSLTISEAGGDAKLSLSISDQAGGGPIAGVAKVSASVSADVSVQMLVDAGFELAKVKFPQFASEIDMAKGLIDAEMAKA